MHLVGNNSSMQPTQLWSVDKSIFLHVVHLWTLFSAHATFFAMKCCTKMPCPLPHNHFCCLLSSPICLPHLLICTCLIVSPIACPPSSVLCWCLLRFFFDICHMSLWLHFGLFVYIFLSDWFLCPSVILSMLISFCCVCFYQSALSFLGSSFIVYITLIIRMVFEQSMCLFNVIFKIQSQLSSACILPANTRPSNVRLFVCSTKRAYGGTLSSAHILQRCLLPTAPLQLYNRSRLIIMSSSQPKGFINYSSLSVFNATLKRRLRHHPQTCAALVLTGTRSFAALNVGHVQTLIL